MPSARVSIAALGALVLAVLAASSCGPSEPSRAARLEDPAGTAEAAAVPRTRQELVAAVVKIQGGRDPLKRFDSLFDAMIAQGPEGVELLLDVFFPESSPRFGRTAVEALVHDLDSDDYKTCRRAAERLYDIGALMQPRLEDALREASPAGRLWLQSILETWKYRWIHTPEVRRNQIWERMGEVRDPALLDIVARRAVALLEKVPLDRGQEEMAHRLVVWLAKSGNDRYYDLLLPYVHHPDVKVAVLVTRAVGMFHESTNWPPLLSAALQSDRPEVVAEAVGWSTNRGDERYKEEVGRLLRRIFEGANEPLRFSTSFALMHRYDDPDARAYLIAQTRSPDRERALKAIAWLGDAVNDDDIPEPALIESLAAYLKSGDTEFRRAAADTLSIYGGEQATRAVIPMLADEKQIIVEETARHLLDHRDKATLRRALKECLDAAPPGPLRDRIAELLGKVADE